MIKASIYNDDDGEITLSGLYYPPCHGAREFGQLIEPDTDADVEILSATFLGEDYELSAREESAAREALWDAVRASWE